MGNPDKYRYGEEANRCFLREQAISLLNFGMRFPSPQGSSYYLGDDGTPMTERPRETWITARMVHVYSLGLKLGHKGSSELVTAGLKGLTGELHDRENGGYFAGIDAKGNALEGKQCYAHAFVILAACSALKAAEEAEATACALLNDALKVYDRYFWNEEEGLSRDTWDTGFKVCEPYRGINANMHSVEAFLAVADVTGREEYRERVGRIIDHVIGWAKTNDWRIPEHFSADWKAEPEYNKDKKDDRFKPYGATPGHGIEWARLITQWAVSVFKTEADGGQTDGLSRADGMARYIEAACNLYDRAVSDAWSDRVPGIAYTTDWNGEPVIRDRMHWTLAEAINTSSVLYRVTGNEKYAADYEKFIRYLDRYVMDHKNGSWFHQLDGDNNVIGTVWPGKPDLYHAVQAMLIPYADIDRSVIFINR